MLTSDLFEIMESVSAVSRSLRLGNFNIKVQKKHILCHFLWKDFENWKILAKKIQSNNSATLFYLKRKQLHYIFLKILTCYN